MSPAEEEQANDPTLLVLNVSTTWDPTAVEVQLRSVWGGALCVSRAARPYTELAMIHAQIQGPDVSPGGSTRWPTE